MNNVCAYCGEIVGQGCKCNIALVRLVRLAHSYQDQGACEATGVGDFIVMLADSLDGEGEKEILEIVDGSLGGLIEWANAARKEITKFKQEIVYEK